jgi:transcriptional regulator with XRE-family HTH domain
MHFERSWKAMAARQARQSPHPPAAWSAPRGRRGADGRWLWTLEERTAQDCGSTLEAAAVAQVRACAAAVRNARRDAGLSLRTMSVRTGIALSVLTGLEQGSAWPSFAVLGEVADELGLRVQLRPAAADLDWPRAESAWRDREQVAAGWHQFVVYQLGRHLDATGLSAREVALRVGVDRQTVSELGNHHPPFSWASVKVLTALAAFVAAELQVEPQQAPWPRPATAGPTPTNHQ